MPRMKAEEQVAAVKRITNKARRDAAALAADESKNRSTRTRAAYKTKAVALDEIYKVVAAK